VWVPALKAAVEKVALPPESVAVPRVLELSRYVTVPVGVPLPETGLTVAVNVTVWPKTDGFNDEVTVVVLPEAISIGVRGEGVNLVVSIWNPT
jgi:hypothetical protein